MVASISRHNVTFCPKVQRIPSGTASEEAAPDGDSHALATATLNYGTAFLSENQTSSKAMRGRRSPCRQETQGQSSFFLNRNALAVRIVAPIASSMSASNQSALIPTPLMMIERMTMR